MYYHSKEFTNLKKSLVGVDGDAVIPLISLSLSGFLSTLGDMFATDFKAGINIVHSPIFNYETISYYAFVVSLKPANTNQCPQHCILQFSHNSESGAVTFLEEPPRG